MMVNRSPSGTTGSQRSHARRDIQGLRGIAVAMVVVYHMKPEALPGGFIGVDIFFVISGFVITAMLLRELSSTGSIDLTRFFKRRISRLLPGVALLILSVLLLSPLFTSPLANQAETAYATTAASLYLSNIYFALSTGGYFQSDAESNPLLHTWSLAVEEQFYLVAPLLMLFAWRRWLKTGVTAAVSLPQ